MAPAKDEQEKRKNELFEELSWIIRLIGVLQRRNRAVRGVPGGGLSLSEIHTLIELEIDPARSMAELGKVLALDPSSVSRTIARLVHRGLVESKPASADGRSRELALTVKGRSAIREADKPANESLGRLAGDLSKDEVRGIEELLLNLTAAMDVPAPRSRKGEHLLRAAQRGVTRGLGLLRDLLPGTRTSISEWQALSVLAFGRHPMGTGEVASEMGISPLALGQILPRLEREGLISRIGRRGRGVKLIATPGCETLLRKVQQPTMDRLLHFFSRAPGSAKKLMTGRAFLERALGRIGDGEQRLPSGDLAQVVYEGGDAAMLRAKLIRTLVERGVEHTSPSRLVDLEGKNIVIRREGRPIALAQYNHGDDFPFFIVWEGAPGEIKKEIRQAFQSLFGIALPS